MAFKGITFAGQNVTPKNDGGLYQAHYGDGILWGCSMAISGDDLVIQSGEFIMGGRVVQVDGATNVDLSGRGLTTGYIQVIMNADMSQGEGSQWYTSFVESASTTFPALTQDDINDTGNLYQLEIAVIQISGGNLTSITSQFRRSFLYSRGSVYMTDENNVLKGKADSYNWTSGVMFGATDPAGTTVGGLYAQTNGQHVLFSNGNPLFFRPNGAGDTTGQVRLTTDGQLHGGVTRTQATGNGRSISGTSYYDILTLSGLDSTGLYVIQAHCIYNLTNNTGQFVWCKFNGFWDESKWIPMKTNWEINHIALVWGQSSYTFQMSPQGSVNGGTVSSVVINAFQIA